MQRHASNDSARLAALLIAVTLASGACAEDKAPPPTASSVPSSASATATNLASASPTPASAYPTASSLATASPSAEPVTAERIVAIGDLHGDYEATRAVLRLGGLIDEEDSWVGGRSRLVQVGDFLDRGLGERQIIALFERMRGEAKAAGGAVHILSGNHELMNTAGRYLYVHPGAFGQFDEFNDGDPTLTVVSKKKRGRRGAFRPLGHYAKIMAEYPVILQLGDTVFVHGGVLPKHVDYGIERINTLARDFYLGKAPKAWGWFATWDSPVNSRHYSKKPNSADCYLLDKVLTQMKAKRMVVGHTPQPAGIASGCGEKVWSTDIGIASCCGSKREVLEIVGDVVRVIK